MFYFLLPTLQLNSLKSNKEFEKVTSDIVIRLEINLENIYYPLVELFRPVFSAPHNIFLPLSTLRKPKYINMALNSKPLPPFLSYKDKLKISLSFNRGVH